MTRRGQPHENPEESIPEKETSGPGARKKAGVAGSRKASDGK